MATGGTNEENRAYFFRLQILIIDGGLLLLRNILDQKLIAQGITLGACLNNERATITRLRNRGKITQVQYDILFPVGGRVPTTSDFDITLIICLFRNLKCVGLNKKFDWNATPLSTDILLEADIWRLKNHRNNICHISTTTGLQPKDFTTWWNDIEQILVRQSPAVLNIQPEIHNFKTCPLDAQEEKRLQKEVEKWEEYEAKVDRLEEEVKKGQEEFNVLKGEVNDMKTRQDNADQIREPRTFTQTKEEKYQEFKTKLKKHLIKFYINERSTIPLSPLVEEKDTPLAGFYVMPDMMLVKQEFHTSDEEEKILVKSLTDLFITDTKLQRKIYILANAGLGKTSFSKYLAISWCQACCPDNNQYCFKDDELKALSNFEFLFLVLLRYSTSVCSIDEMIEQQIIKKLPPASQCSLQDILDREKCWIILDGLDEWTHPDNEYFDQREKIPHRYARDNCVILTTTRPWKLGVSNLKTSDIDKKVELVQLSEDSTSQLEKNAIRKMSGLSNDSELDEKSGTLIQL